MEPLSVWMPRVLNGASSREAFQGTRPRCRNKVLGRVYPEALDHGIDGRKPFFEIGPDGTAVQIDIPGGLAFHLVQDSPGDHIPGGKFRVRMIGTHETFLAVVDQDRAFASYRLGNKEPRSAGHVENGRVELNKLQVAQGRPAAVRGRHTVPGGNGGIGRLLK